MDIKYAGELYPGEIVYKYRAPGEEYYDLPDRYMPYKSSFNGDLNDYYHVGVVLSIAPLVIIHCTTKDGPIARNTSIGAWRRGGRLVGIDYGCYGPGKKGDANMVTIRGGNERLPINMRGACSTDATLVAKIPQGSTAELISAGTEWTHIKFNGQDGYVLTKFVHGGEDDKSADDGEKILVNRAELESAYDIIGNLLGMRG